MTDIGAHIFYNNTAGNKAIESVSPSEGSDSGDLWYFFKEECESAFGESAVANWIGRLRLQRVSSCEMVISADSRFVKDWVSTHYLRKMKQISEQMLSKKLTLILSEVGKETVRRQATNQPRAHVQNKAVLSCALADTVSSPLNKHMSFENFIPGAANRMMYQAALAACEEQRYLAGESSMYFHASVGLGKTHLLQAIVHKIRKHSPDRSVIYMSAEKFMHRYVNALRNKDMAAFKDTFRAADVLLIDDIQFICGKESTQEEFYHTVLHLLDNKKRIIVAGDRAPSALEGLHERLRSRFSGGLVVAAERPDPELRLGILRAKREQLANADISDEVLHMLSEHVTANVRELEGALYRLAAHATLMHEEITEDKARIMLKDVLADNRRVVSIQDIQRKICDYYSISQADLLSAGRSRAIVLPRQTAMYLSKKLTSRSLSEISRRFRKKDHTTVIHAVKRIEEQMKINKDLREDMTRLEASLLQ